MSKVGEKLDWLPIHFSDPAKKWLIPDSAIIEEVDLNVCKNRVDKFISQIPLEVPADVLHIGGNYFLAIEPFIENGKYMGLKIKNESKIPKNMMYTSLKSKFHK